jgi:hypothetical protein
MKTIKREDIQEDIYQNIFKREKHHNHEIVEDCNGIYKWRENYQVRDLVEKINLNDLIPLLHHLGFGKNSEIYRKLYRDMGYSLNGYWEVFYWEVNNEDSKKYKGKK